MAMEGLVSSFPNYLLLERGPPKAQAALKTFKKSLIKKNDDSEQEMTLRQLRFEADIVISLVTFI